MNLKNKLKNELWNEFKQNLGAYQLKGRMIILFLLQRLQSPLLPAWQQNAGLNCPKYR